MRFNLSIYVEENIKDLVKISSRKDESRPEGKWFYDDSKVPPKSKKGLIISSYHQKTRERRPLAGTTEEKYEGGIFNFLPYFVLL